jgi:hypothetical protein
LTIIPQRTSVPSHRLTALIRIFPDAWSPLDSRLVPLRAHFRRPRRGISAILGRCFPPFTNLILIWQDSCRRLLTVCRDRLSLPGKKKGGTRPPLPKTPLVWACYFSPFSIPSTRSKSSSVAYSMTILPFPFRSRILTRTPRMLSSSRCAALTFGSTQRAPPAAPSP